MALGEIRMVAFDFAPQGWLHCDGKMLQRSAEPQLFAAIGTHFGGQSSTTFALPDFRDRAPIGVNADYRMGLTGAILMGARNTNDREMATTNLSYIIAKTHDDWDEAFIGEVRMFAGAAHPPGWLRCNGRLVESRPFATLHYVLQDRFKAASEESSEEHFRLPNLARRVPLGNADKIGAAWGMDGFRTDSSQPASVLAIDFFICGQGRMPSR